MLLFLFIFVIFYNASFNEFFYGIETIKSNNSGSISLYFFTTMFPNIVLMIIFMLKIGMTKDDIIETLQSRELNYEYDTVNWGDHQSGTLHTCSFSAGTLLPKGTVVWFSIDE